MRSLKLTTLVYLALSSACVIAAVPQKPQYSQFYRLVSNSPFTIKATPTQVIKETPLERDWSLGSISPSGEGYTVTLINKKNRKERIRFLPGFSAGDYKLHEVKQNTQSSKMSKVLISKGGQKAWIGYDEKVVALRAAAKPAAKKSAPVRTSSSRGGPPIPGKSSTSPRVRHVPRKK